MSPAPLQLLRMVAAWLAGITLAVSVGAAETPPAWQPVDWNGEKALTSTSQGWKAIVSLERGRLMHFGPADQAVNLILAPVNRDNPNVLGGHRLWLGPQATWPQTWPPPKEWESSAPESFTNDGGLLRMVMADAGDGWPRLIRTYRWDGARLICGGELSGGQRSAQIIHIIQMPEATLVEAVALADATARAGYVLLPAGPVARLTAQFAPPPHVSRAGRALQFHKAGSVLKLGFRPQTLAGRGQGLTLRVSRGVQTGLAAAAPDQGYFTQVYLAGPEPFIELEQLSPQFAAGAPASFAIVLEGVAR